MHPDLRYLRRRRGRADRIAALEIDLGFAEPLMLQPIRGYHPKPGEACTVIPDLGLVLPAGAQLHALASAGQTAAQATAALHSDYRTVFDARSDSLEMLDVRGAPLKQPSRVGLYMAMLACPLSSAAFLLPLLLAHLHV